MYTLKIQNLLTRPVTNILFNFKFSIICYKITFEGSPAEAVESPKPYSLLAMLGDDFLSDENCIPVYRECLLLDSNLQDIRNDLKTCFARHFESYKDRRIRTLEVQLDELVSVLTTEYEIKQQLNEER